MGLSDLATFAEHGTLAALVIVLWWMERQERMKLQDKLDDCLSNRAEREQE